jgi:hypothetical protein
LATGFCTGTVSGRKNHCFMWISLMD